MIALFTEDQSDHDMIAIIIRRIAKQNKIPIKGKGFRGGSNLIKDGAKSAKAFSGIKQLRKIIICHDSDKKSVKEMESLISRKIINESGLSSDCFLTIIPMEEIEAWILADINACQFVFKGMKRQKEIMNPENASDPKEYLEKACRENATPKYSNATHNKFIAEHLNLDVVYRKCPSFRPLFDEVRKMYPN